MRSKFQYLGHSSLLAHSNKLDELIPNTYPIWSHFAISGGKKPIYGKIWLNAIDIRNQLVELVLMSFEG